MLVVLSALIEKPCTPFDCSADLKSPAPEDRAGQVDIEMERPALGTGHEVDGW